VETSLQKQIKESDSEASGMVGLVLGVKENLEIALPYDENRRK